MIYLQYINVIIWGLLAIMYFGASADVIKMERQPLFVSGLTSLLLFGYWFEQAFIRMP